MSRENAVDSTSSGDDSTFDAGQGYQSFDDIPVPIGPMGEALGLRNPEESLPDDDESNLDPEDSVEDVPQEDTTDEDDTDEAEAESEEDEEEEDDSSEEDSTDESDLPSEDDIDWDYKVPVKVDGEEKYVTLSELRKGFATDQHLSKKGREVGELEKKLKDEYGQKVSQVEELGTILSDQLMTEENRFAKEYHDLESKIDKAREEGDTYELGRLKDKRESVQKKYWQARKQREGLSDALKKKQEEAFQAQVKEMMDTFEKEIKELVPDFDPPAIRQFALDEGIPEDLLDGIMDAKVVKFIDDYRKLKTKTSTGAAKRKQAPKAKKSIPAKKGNVSQNRKNRSQEQLRKTVLSGQGDDQANIDFLKSISKFS